jgi:hypothetical protein
VAIVSGLGGGGADLGQWVLDWGVG